MVFNTPPRRLERMWAAHERAQARTAADQLDVLLHAGESDWGTASRWVGKGTPPKSDFEYSSAGLLSFRERLLRRAAGLPPELSPEERLERDQAEYKRYWAKQKSMQA